MKRIKKVSSFHSHLLQQQQLHKHSAPTSNYSEGRRRRRSSSSRASEGNEAGSALTDLTEYPGHVVVDLGVDPRPAEHAAGRGSEGHDSDRHPPLVAQGVAVQLHQGTARVAPARVLASLAPGAYLTLAQVNPGALVGPPAGFRVDQRQADLELDLGLALALGLAPAGDLELAGQAVAAGQADRLDVAREANFPTQAQQGYVVALVLGPGLVALVDNLFLDLHGDGLVGAHHTLVAVGYAVRAGLGVVLSKPDVLEAPAAGQGRALDAVGRGQDVTLVDQNPAAGRRLALSCKSSSTWFNN